MRNMSFMYAFFPLLWNDFFLLATASNQGLDFRTFWQDMNCNRVCLSPSNSGIMTPGPCWHPLNAPSAPMENVWQPHLERLSTTRGTPFVLRIGMRWADTDQTNCRWKGSPLGFDDGPCGTGIRWANTDQTNFRQKGSLGTPNRM